MAVNSRVVDMLFRAARKLMQELGGADLLHNFTAPHHQHLPASVEKYQPWLPPVAELKRHCHSYRLRSCPCLMFKVDLNDAILAGLLERSPFDATADVFDSIRKDRSRRTGIRLRDLVLAFVLPSRGDVMLKVLLTHIDEGRCKDICG